MVVFEACSFQDITGQRIAKVVETLQHIEERVSRFADGDARQGHQRAAERVRARARRAHGRPPAAWAAACRGRHARPAAEASTCNVQDRWSGKAAQSDIDAPFD